MADLPKLLPASAESETLGGVTEHIGGELMPVLTIDVSQTAVLLWKHMPVAISLRNIRGFAEADDGWHAGLCDRGARLGLSAFRRDGAGHIVPMRLEKGRALHVREHQFLAATSSIDERFERLKGLANMLSCGAGFFIDKSHSHAGDGILRLHGYGNVLEKVLVAGESIDIEPGGRLYKNASVTMETTVDRLTSGLLGGMNLILHRFTGPGHVGIQSMYMH